MANRFRPKHPQNPTPESSGQSSSTSDPDRTSGKLRAKLQGKMPTNPTPVATPPVKGRKMGDGMKDTRRR